jgi:hypothetical protein
MHHAEPSMQNPFQQWYIIASLLNRLPGKVMSFQRAQTAVAYITGKEVLRHGDFLYYKEVFTRHADWIELASLNPPVQTEAHEPQFSELFNLEADSIRLTPVGVQSLFRSGVGDLYGHSSRHLCALIEMCASPCIEGKDSELATLAADRLFLAEYATPCTVLDLIARIPDVDLREHASENFHISKAFEPLI